MALTVLTKEDAQVIVVEQTAFGTAGLDNAAGIILDIETVAFDFDDKVVESNPAVASRVEDDRGFFTHQNRAMPKVEITGIVHNDHIARFMYGFFQSVTEPVGSPFGKTFIPHASQPDFTANAGYFFTLIIDQSVASVAHKVADMVVAELKFDQQPGEPLKYTASCVGRGPVAIDSNPSGSYTRAVQSFYFGENQLTHTIDFGGDALTPINAGGFQIEFAQTVEAVGMDGSGSFNTYMLKKKGGSYKEKALFDATSRTAFANRAANTPVDITVKWGNASSGTVDLDLNFALHGKIKPETTQNVDDILGVDIDVKLTGDIENSTEMATVIIADDTDMSW